MKRRLWLMIACLLLPACRISVPDGVLPCQSASDCPVAWACERNRCTQSVSMTPVLPRADAAVARNDLQPDAATPSDEDAGGPTCAADGCPCRAGDTRACYTGSPETVGRGRCTAGSALCENGRFGACRDERLPAYESCTNLGVDDDCDGQIDEALGVGMPCTAADQLGQCASGTLQCQAAQSAPVCVTGSPVAESCNGLDDDCDGQHDEAFVLTSDPQHCGSCGVVCASEHVCCGGQCQAAWPEDYGAECGGACDTPGTIQCDGSCSRADPPDLEQECGRCGGRIQCDGSCSHPEPADFGERCSDGRSKIGCSGSCECERQCPSGQIIPCTSLCPILCIGNICIEL
jgi:hypothetical protein